MSLSAYKIPKVGIQLGIEDLYQAKTDPKMRLTATPFVNDAENSVFVGRAVPWKGNPTAMPDEVKAGLANAQRVSKECEGVKGTVTVGGRRLPKHDYCEMQAAGKASKTAF